MFNIRLTLLMFALLSPFAANANELNTSKENNSSFELVKVNNHTITSKILGPKKVHAFVHKFTNNDRTYIMNQLVNDEIAIQYAFEYLKKDDNETNEKKRLNSGLTYIHKIALEESMKLIGDKNVSDFYESHKKDFWHKTQYSASQILVKDINLSKSLIKKLSESKDLNQTFKSLATKNSTDVTSKNGGYLGFFEPKIMVKPFREALLKLKENQFTKTPVKTKFGYHIIYLHKISKEGYVPLEKVQNLIKTDLAKRKVAKWFKKTLEPLKKKAKIKYLFKSNATH